MTLTCLSKERSICDHFHFVVINVDGVYIWVSISYETNICLQHFNFKRDRSYRVLFFTMRLENFDKLFDSLVASSIVSIVYLFILLENQLLVFDVFSRNKFISYHTSFNLSQI